MSSGATAPSSRLIGHDNPSGRYPSPVVPILALGDRLAVVFAADGPSQRVEIDSEAQFVHHDARLQSSLQEFDPDVHRLFAFDETHVVLYEVAKEPRFFEDVLEDANFAGVNPFLRLALAKTTQQAHVIRRELLACLATLQSTPDLRDSWYRAQYDDIAASKPPWLETLASDWRGLTGPPAPAQVAVKPADVAPADRSPFTIATRVVGDIVILDIPGNVTIGNGGDETLKHTVEQLVRDGYRKIVLNLERMGYVDGAGLAEIVRAYINVGRLGGTLKLLNLTKRFEDLLVITKLHDLLASDTYLSEAEAIRSFSQQRGE